MLEQLETLLFFAILPFIVSMFAIWYYNHRVRQRSVFESKVERLEENKEYLIKYKTGPLNLLSGYYIINTKEEYLSLLTINTRHSGVKSATINVYEPAGNIVFSVYFDKYVGIELT